MEFAEEKRRLIEQVINHRIRKEDFSSFARVQGVNISNVLLEKWEKQFYQTHYLDFTNEPRLINRFCIGADPEFGFVNQGKFVHASGLGLNTTEAFGADMTGRQAELRAYPSRSVLEVVASILDTLRHMANAHPLVLNYQWVASAMILNDGCGGHVHIGRKRPNMNTTLKSLNQLTDLLIRANIVDKNGSEIRRVQTNYGRPSDIRLQPHGYEYRTMPTWLSSPRSAFLVLTLSKLCVYHQLNETKGLDLPTQLASKTTIENLLRAYANVDDDAKIALMSIEKFGLPSFSNVDFKVTWGINLKQVEKRDKSLKIIRYYYPPVIKPSEATCKELFMCLTRGELLPPTVPEPTWTPFALDPDIHVVNYEFHQAGLPEIAMGLLSKAIKIRLKISDLFLDKFIRISLPEYVNLDKLAIREYGKKLKLSVQVTHREIIPDGDDEPKGSMIIMIPSNVARNFVVDKDKVAAIRTLLAKSGLFPIAKAESIVKIDMKKFAAVKKKEKKLIGNVLFSYTSSPKEE